MPVLDSDGLHRHHYGDTKSALAIVTGGSRGLGRGVVQADELIVPKYNRAGARKITWVWPGNTPNNEPTSANDKFGNRYFPMEAEALRWVTP